jgi:diguanylate cyclase (GGDEF)-like protein
MDKRLIEEISRAKRYELPLSVLLIDIDHFKQINDTYGHQIGDDVLKNLGKLIPETLRENDIVARYGGEEIFAILPNTSDSDAIIAAERLRHKIESTALIKDNKVNKDEAKNITVSIGLAAVGYGVNEASELIKKADSALYSAKQRGRNQVAVKT